MAAYFAAREVTQLKRLGFDDEAVPPWVMVPMNGTRNVTLMDGDQLSLQIRTLWNPGGSSVVTFQEQSRDPLFGRFIELKGISPGTALLEARDANNNQLRATLEINVKERRTLSVCCCFVVDKSLRRSSAGMGESMTMIEGANLIYLPQANIELSLHNSKAVRLPFDMPRGVPVDIIEPGDPSFSVPGQWYRPTTPGPLPCIASQPPAPRKPWGAGGCPLEESQGPLSLRDFQAIRRYQMLCNIVAWVDSTTDYTFFLVRDLDRPFDTGAFTPHRFNSRVALNASIIPGAHANGHVLAHELGHYLLTPGPSFLDSTGHSHGKHDLMQESPGPGDGFKRGDFKIPKDQANYMNSSGCQYIRL
jgi:hypothetical protein